MPPSWRDEYVLSLKDVERNNPVNMELIQTCSQMADRIAALEAEKLALEARISTQNADKTTKSSTTASVDPGVTQLRLELAESLRSKGVAETRLRAAGEELDKLRARTKGDAGFIRELGTEMAELRTKLRDREHELREKKKLLDNVQDEMIGLELQLSVVEKDKEKVKKENEELIDRWMKRMAKEADALNLANEPNHDDGRPEHDHAT